MSPRTLILLGLCALALTACGRRGTLMPPAAPVFGPASGPPAPAETKRSDKPDSAPKNPTPTP